MASGKYPATRPDGLPWTEEDASEESLAGIPLGFKAFIYWIKSDWMELVTTMGFPSWASVEHCCFQCDASHATWENWAGLNPLATPWGVNDVESYDAACAACEHPRTVTPDEFPKLRGTLFFDRRKQGNRGRALKKGLDLLSGPLLKGDRVEPSPGMVHTCLLDIAAMPPNCRLLEARRRDLCSPPQPAHLS